VDWQEASAKSGNLAVYYSNRAACWLKRKQFQPAIEDCNEVRPSRQLRVALSCLGAAGVLGLACLYLYHAQRSAPSTSLASLCESDVCCWSKPSS
jgi:hypothetical protein